MCFFWPASTAGNLPYHSVVLKCKKPNAEEGTTLAANSSSAVPANTPPPPAPPMPHLMLTLSRDLVVRDLSSIEDNSSSSVSFGLKSCESVALDIRDVPGVSFVRGGKPDWTPVVSLSKRKREKWKERKKLLSLPAIILVVAVTVT